MNIKRYQMIRVVALSLVLGMGASMASAAVICNDMTVVCAKKKKIGKKKAKNIALKDAGFKKSEVDYLNCDLDYEDDYDTDIYEVEFVKDMYEYSYDIHAYSGKILDKDVDYEDD